MSNRAETLAQQREKLIERCGLQREHLAMQGMAFRQSLGTFKGFVRIGANLRRNPLPLAAFAIGLFIFRPKRLLSLAVSATAAWQAWQKLSPLFDAVFKRQPQ